MWTTLYTDTSVSLLVAMPGDFNADGVVDAGDYVTWRKTGGTPTNYEMWRSNYGRMAELGAGAGDGAPAVPEPSPMLLIIIGLLTIAPLCRSQARRGEFFARSR
jgi:hypothetical protein